MPVKNSLFYVAILNTILYSVHLKRQRERERERERELCHGLGG